MGVLGIIALVCGVVYVVLASRAVYISWLFGILSCAIIAYEDFTLYGLIADGWLQIFYILMGGLALAQWKKTDTSGQLEIQTWSVKRHSLIFVLGILISIPLGMLLRDLSLANLPVIDTVTSVFAVIATALMVFRIKENWIYWILIDTAYLYIYGAQGAWFYVALMFVYTIVAVLGWRKWTEIQREQINALI
jgi:nicotinamide mononucleotide transporter